LYRGLYLKLMEKQKYMNKYDVISFDDAIKKFPKADVFITYSHTPTALDCCTRETFLKIKQVDMFDRVVGNLKKLPLHKTRFYLKYIFLDGVNDNDETYKNYKPTP